MDVVDVFAEITCPFTYVGMRRFVAARSSRGLSEPRLRVHAWPLELVNGEPMTGPGVAPKVAALRASVAPDLFAAFDPSTFPASTLGLLAAEAAAHEAGPEVGERFSLQVRSLLFDRGIDPSEPDVLEGLLTEAGVDPGGVDPTAPHTSWEDGITSGVTGSPYFVVGNRAFFCPTLDIHSEGDVPDVRYDIETLDRFFAKVFDEPVMSGEPR